MWNHGQFLMRNEGISSRYAAEKSAHQRLFERAFALIIPAKVKTFAWLIRGLLSWL
jgi:hypothetical protein